MGWERGWFDPQWEFFGAIHSFTWVLILVPWDLCHFLHSPSKQRQPHLSMWAMWVVHIMYYSGCVWEGEGYTPMEFLPGFLSWPHKISPIPVTSFLVLAPSSTEKEQSMVSCLHYSVHLTMFIHTYNWKQLFLFQQLPHMHSSIVLWCEYKISHTQFRDTGCNFMANYKGFPVFLMARSIHVMGLDRVSLIMIGELEQSWCCNPVAWQIKLFSPLSC